MSFSFRDLFNNRQQEDEDDFSELSFLEARAEEPNDFFIESEDKVKMVSPFELVETSETHKAYIDNQGISGFDSTNQADDGLSLTNDDLHESIASGFYSMIQSTINPKLLIKLISERKLKVLINGFHPKEF